MEMTGTLLNEIREIENHRMLIAAEIPILGSGLALVATILVPRGKAKGLITGAYMLLACLGAACLLFVAVAAMAGAPIRLLIPLLVPGIALAVVMGIFSPEIIRQYQQFEFRKLAAEIFRRS
jgi:hypothetical protein